MSSSPPQKKPRLYRGLTPKQLANERRERLLAAALSLFSEQGYAKTPIELLCATAKVATRHFYEEFDGREAVLRALFDDITEQVNQRVAAALEAEHRALHLRVSDAVHNAVSFLLDDPRRARIFCVESIGVSLTMEKHRRDSVHHVAALVEQYTNFMVESGEFPQRDYRLPSVAVAGMINELMVEWLVNDTGFNAGEIAREAVILLRAIVTGARNYQAVD